MVGILGLFLILMAFYALHRWRRNKCKHYVESGMILHNMFKCSELTYGFCNFFNDVAEPNSGIFVKSHAFMSVNLTPWDVVGKRIDKQHSFQNRTQDFNLRELRTASKNFSNKIGEGGFGPVYYGKLADGQEVAIKVSNGISKQGQSEFFTEVGTSTAAKQLSIL